jgi:hypothetical protein
MTINHLFTCIGAVLRLDATIEETNLREGSHLVVVRQAEKIRVAVTNSDKTMTHFKLARYVISYKTQNQPANIHKKNNNTYFHFRSDPMSAFMDQYSRHVHTPLEQLTFNIENKRLDPKRTPEELGLTEKDIIVVNVNTVLIIVKNEVDSTTEKYTIGAKTNLKYLLNKYVARQAEKGNTAKITFTFQGQEIAEGIISQ